MQYETELNNLLANEYLMQVWENLQEYVQHPFLLGMAIYVWLKLMSNFRAKDVLAHSDDTALLIATICVCLQSVGFWLVWYITLELWKCFII